MLLATIIARDSHEGDVRIRESLHVQRNGDSAHKHEYGCAGVGRVQQQLACQLCSEIRYLCCSRFSRSRRRPLPESKSSMETVSPQEFGSMAKMICAKLRSVVLLEKGYDVLHNIDK